MLKKQILWKQVFKRSLYSVSFLIVSTLYTVLNRSTGREVQIAIFLDNLIPFNKYFIYAYVSWYIYMAVFIIYFCIFDEKKYYKVLIGINAGMIISYLIYFIFPTTVSRPVFNPGNDLTGSLFRWLYSVDNPYNCFPSIHVINTLIIAIYVHKDNLYLNKFIKIISVITALMIIYSTFAIKQHVILDAVSAMIIAFGLYVIMDYTNIFKNLKDNSNHLNDKLYKNGVV